MSELRKANTDHPYFVTFTIAGWIDLFTRERYNEIILDSLKYCIINKGLRVHEYIIMPSHIHMIIQHLDCKLPDVIRDFKSFTAKEIIKCVDEPGESRKDWIKYLFGYFAKKIKQNKENMVWQKTSHPIELNNNKLYDQKADYIRMNPVASGYVTDEQAWKYSSACFDSPLKLEDGLLA
tara:strand:- start:2012 stop:2548 length:537 start_codon:yes stop_codon:yes gene_type:complete